MRKKKQNNLILIIILILVLIITTPLILGLFGVFNSNDNNKNDITTEQAFFVKDFEFNFAEGSPTLDLSSGYIKTTSFVTDIFINVKGCGCEKLNYSYEYISSDDETYILFNLMSSTNILGLAFFDDTTLSIDVYCEYNGLSYYITTLYVDCIGGWTDFY